MNREVTWGNNIITRRSGGGITIVTHDYSVPVPFMGQVRLAQTGRAAFDLDVKQVSLRCIPLCVVLRTRTVVALGSPAPWSRDTAFPAK